MKLLIKKGTTNRLQRIFIQDTTQSDARGLAGLAFNTSNLAWTYCRDDDGNAGANSVSIVTATRGTWTSGGFKEKDATNAKGMYEIGIPNAALATGSNSVSMLLFGAASMAVTQLEIQLTDFDPEDATKLGLTNLGDVYTADIHVDFTSTGDEYTVVWFKNGVRQTSGITTPTIQVTKRSDGTDLIAATAMTQIGTTGSYKYDEPTNVIGNDVSVIVVVSASISSGTRTWGKVISKEV